MKYISLIFLYYLKFVHICNLKILFHDIYDICTTNIKELENGNTNLIRHNYVYNWLRPVQTY